MSGDLAGLARLAYQAYGRETGGKNYQGLPMPEWGDLPSETRAAWIAAADSVRNRAATAKARAIAERLILEYVDDIDFSIIAEQNPNLSDGEMRDLSDLIGSARVTVTWED